MRQNAGKEIMVVGNSQLSSVATGQYASMSGGKQATSSQSSEVDFSARLNTMQAEIAGSGKKLPSSLVFLGRLDRQAPTVSHLLVQSPYKNDCWDILGKKVNADKPFTRIPDGEAIYMDPETGEIVWGKETGGQPAAVSDLPGPVDKTMSMPPLPARTSFTAASLDAAAARYMGTAYERMDCYELVVAGLETMGIQYRGQEGLGRYLINQAVDKGMAMNHHLTGEGVTRAIGRDMHVVALDSVPRVDAAVDKALEALSEKLEPGQILSFSTPTRGHTGVVSRRGNTWTFINAGVMDNPVTGRPGGRAVGEEHLNAEIRNWVTRAHKEESGLRITLGSPDPVKLARFQSGDEATLSLKA